MQRDSLLFETALAFRLALRELRGGRENGLKRFGVFLTCLALGVGAVAGVGSLAASLEAGLGQDAKRLLGGDLEIRLSHREMAPQALDHLRSQAEVSRMVRMRAMARPLQSEAGSAPASLVELKAVDNAYPLYGNVELAPSGGLHQMLTMRNGEFGAVAERGLLARLGLEVGDAVTLGKAVFRLRAVLEKEPDRPGNFFGLGPRLMISMEGFQATQLAVPGSVVYHYYRLRLPGQAAVKDVEAFRAQLKQDYQDSGWRFRIYTAANEGLERSLDNLAVYLTLVGLASLLVGGVGAANGVRAHLAAKTTVIASMKCLGASRRLAMTTYLVQVTLLALLGGALGLLAGAAAAHVGANFLSNSLQMAVRPGIYWGPLAVALAFGVLTALAFSLPALSAASQVEPARLWRGYSDPRQGKPTALARLAVAGLSLLLFLLGWIYTGQLALVAGFAAAVLLAATVFRVCAWAVMRLAARAARPKALWLAHGLVNVHRPGASTPQVVFSLGLGLTVLTVVAMAQGNMTRQIEEQMPQDAPSFFFIDIPESQAEPFVQMLRSTKGVKTVEYEPSLRGRIVKIDGLPAGQVEVPPDYQWVLRGDRGMTYAAHKPDDIEITAGEWWPPDYAGPPRICLTEGIAGGLGLDIGETITVNLLGREVTAEVACLRAVEWQSLSLNHSIIFAPGTLENAPKAYVATAYASLESEDVIFRRTAEEFPQAVIIYLKDVLQEVAGLISQIGAAVKATAGVTLLAGLLVLAETLRAAMRARQGEAVMLKVLGATRTDIALTLLAEFALLGLAAALVSAVLGAMLGWVFVTFVMNIPWNLLWRPLACVILGGPAATLALGVVYMHHLLGQEAWPVLRNE